MQGSRTPGPRGPYSIFLTLVGDHLHVPLTPSVADTVHFTVQD